MEDKVTIYLYREATNQLMRVSGHDAILGYSEIKKALLGEKHGKDLGRLAADFRIEVMKPNQKTEIYKSYDRGYILMDDNNSYLFEYGNKWYESLQLQLKKMLSNDPNLFMK